MSSVINFLQMQAQSIDDTASRCTDPEIVAELAHISAQLRKEALRLETISGGLAQPPAMSA